MNEDLFILCQDDFGNYEIRHDDKIFFFLWEVAPILNEQQDTISELNKQIEQLNLAIDDLLTHISCDEIKKENKQLYHLKVLAHAFIVEKGLEGEFIKWSKENEISSLKKGCGD